MNEILWPEFCKQPPKELGVKRRDVWQRMQAGLYLMATTGWSVVQELMAGLAERYGIQSNADSLHRIFSQYLRKAGLIDYQVLPHTIGNGLAVVQLTRCGKIFCSDRGWSATSSDWDKLLDYHDGENQRHHTAMVLDFAWQARRRGYTAEVMPIVESKYMMPDVYVERGTIDQAYVEVERGQNKPGKWHNLLSLQGFVAVCVATSARRRTVVQKEIRYLGMGGLATDLETLKIVGKSKNKQQLWVDRW